MLIRNRLRLFTITALCGLLLITVLVLSQLVGLKRALDRVVGESLLHVTAATELQTRFLVLQKTSYQHAVELDVDRMQTLEQQLRTEISAVASGLRQLKQQLATGSGHSRMQEFERAWLAWLEVQTRVRLLSESGEMMKALNLANTVGAPHADRAATAMHQIVNGVRQQAAAQQKNAAHAVNQSIAWAAGVAGAVLLLLLSMSVWLKRTMVTPLLKLRSDVERVVREQDFTVRCSSVARDEIGDVARALDTLMLGLQQTLGEVVQQAAIMAGAVDSTRVVADRVEQNTKKQQDATEIMAQAMQRLSQNMNGLLAETTHSRQISEQCGQLAGAGQATIMETTRLMNRLAGQIEQSARILESLLSQVKRISAVGGVIRELADQTNLLALNAAIEAARAGEQGRGFAVVADEVRKLAERTTVSTSGINDLVRSIQQEAASMNHEIQQALQQGALGARQSEDAGEMMTQVSNATQQALQVISSMTTLIEEQGSASLDMTRQVSGVATMAIATREQAALSAETTGRLQTVAIELQRICGAYRLRAA